MYVTVRGSGRYVGRTRLRDRVRHISLSESQCKHHNMDYHPLPCLSFCWKKVCLAGQADPLPFRSESAQLFLSEGALRSFFLSEVVVARTSCSCP